jgi:hypothetical protein
MVIATKYYFDSYGSVPHTELLSYLQSPIHYNIDEVQPRGTVACGHLCLNVLKKLSMGCGFQEILNSLI